jgi:hypothetical protein
MGSRHRSHPRRSGVTGPADSGDRGCVRSPSLLIKQVGEGCASGAKPTIIGRSAMTSINKLTPGRRFDAELAGSTRYPQFSLIACG